jgi:hypothetical protein
MRGRVKERIVYGRHLSPLAVLWLVRGGVHRGSAYWMSSFGSKPGVARSVAEDRVGLVGAIFFHGGRQVILIVAAWFSTIVRMSLDPTFARAEAPPRCVPKAQARTSSGRRFAYARGARS